MLVTVVALICSSATVFGLFEGTNPCERLPNGPGSTGELIKAFQLSAKFKYLNFSGFVNDPRDCAAYFTCVGGQPFSAVCPNGFYFDEEREVCDLPQFVNCNRCPATGRFTVRLLI